MRLKHYKDIDEMEEMSDLDSSHINRYSRSSTSKINQKVRRNHNAPRIKEENYVKVCIEVPVERKKSLKKGMKYLGNLKDEVLCYSIEYTPTNSKRFDRTMNGSLTKNDIIVDNFRGSTQNSINDLYKQIKDIQSNLGTSPLNSVVDRDDNGDQTRSYPVGFEQNFPKQIPKYETDLAVSEGKTTAEYISPIICTAVESNGSCCFCCHLCKRRIIKRGQYHTDLTHRIDELAECSKLTQYPRCRWENNDQNHGIHNAIKKHYPLSNVPFQPDTGISGRSCPPGNKNERIVFDLDTKFQSPCLPQIGQDAYLLPIKEICSRPCNCKQNVMPNYLYPKTVVCTNTNEIIPIELLGMKNPLTPSGLSVRASTGRHHCNIKDVSTSVRSSDLPSQEYKVRPSPKKIPSKKSSIPTTYEGLSSKKGSTNSYSLSDQSSSHGIHTSSTEAAERRSSQRSNLLTESQTSFKQAQASLNQSNYRNMCNCGLSGDLSAIMNKIEENIIKKIEKNELFANGPANIQVRKSSENSSEQLRESEVADLTPLRLEESSEDSASSSLNLIEIDSEIDDNNADQRPGSDSSQQSLLINERPNYQLVRIPRGMRSSELGEVKKDNRRFTRNSSVFSRKTRDSRLKSKYQSGFSSSIDKGRTSRNLQQFPVEPGRRSTTLTRSSLLNHGLRNRGGRRSVRKPRGIVSKRINNLS